MAGERVGPAITVTLATSTSFTNWPARDARRFEEGERPGWICLCRGIELDPPYVDVILRRYRATTWKRAILLETGQTFESLAGAKIKEIAWSKAGLARRRDRRAVRPSVN
jgi:hypothetical protein